MKVKKGDKVLVISGKDKGKVSKVAKALPSLGKIIVEGVNIKKKHVRPRREGEKGQTVQMPGMIDVSNVKLICGKCDKATRVGYRILGDKDKASKTRICKKCEAEI